ncbi:MAG: cyclic-di-AMP receptor [Acetobacteraceae bacterium]|nr:cyclic-di-AMP receptor [Acetobacteraceae bacterium]
MKLIVAVVQDKDAPRLLQALVARGLRATRLASSGGFLREGNVTLLLGLDDGRVEEALAIIAETCKSRQQLVTPLSPIGGPVDSYVPYPIQVQVGGATVFVLQVERYVKL